MQFRFWQREKMYTSLSLYLKCSAIFSLFLLSVLVVACGSGAATVSGSGNLGNPPVTVTIQLGVGNGSPTPSLPPYSCGAWATNTTPAYNTTQVGVYAKFVQNVDGNPQGVDAATATATVTWADGSVTTLTAQTTADGLAVFAVPTAGRVAAINHFTFVTITFHKDGIPDCNVGQDKAAFFTLVVVSPTANTPTPGNGTPTSSPTVTGPVPTCTPQPTRNPKPRRTPIPLPPPFCQ